MEAKWRRKYWEQKMELKRKEQDNAKGAKKSKKRNFDILREQLG